MAEAPNRLDRYVELGRDISARALQLAEEAPAAVREKQITLTLRDRAMIGLALKIDSAFDALLVDAAEYRSEAMHHLKTMAEAAPVFLGYREAGRRRSSRPDPR